MGGVLEKHAHLFIRANSFTFRFIRMFAILNTLFSSHRLIKVKYIETDTEAVKEQTLPRTCVGGCQKQPQNYTKKDESCSRCLKEAQAEAKAKAK